MKERKTGLVRSTRMAGTRLICCAQATVTPPLRQHQQHTPLFNRIGTLRRNIILLSFVSTTITYPLRAISFGIPGPKEWLKEQKKKASKFLLAPIDASRQSLRNALLLLTVDSGSTTPTNLIEVQRLLKSAASDCVPKLRNSFVSFQAQTGVEVCTFRLIVKNASSLLDDNDPVKLKVEAILDDVIRSFTSLDDAVGNYDLQVASNRQKVEDGLIDTIATIDKFEQGIKDCLDT